MIKKLAEDFARREIKPYAAITDEESRFPIENVRKLFQYGFFGITCPREYGGQGCDTMSYVLMLEEIAKVCATTAVITSVHGGLCMYLIYKYGTTQQKEKWLPRMNKDCIGCFALTEAGAGTDASGVRTVAKRVEGLEIPGDSRADSEKMLNGSEVSEKKAHYILNGSKIFITNAGQAGVYIILASTSPELGTRGITAFIVDADNPGLSVGPCEHKMGIRGSATCEVVLTDCVVSEDDILGNIGQGFKLALSGLDCGRIGIGTQAVGIAQGAIDETKAYVNERHQFGKRISSFQNTQFTLAQLQSQTDACRLMVWRAAAFRDAGKPFGKEAAMAKLLSSQNAVNVTEKCVQLHGGYGYIRDYPVERMMRDAKITEIYEGTSEAQKIVISRGMEVY